MKGKNLDNSVIIGRNNDRKKFITYQQEPSV